MNRIRTTPRALRGSDSVPSLRLGVRDGAGVAQPTAAVHAAALARDARRRARPRDGGRAIGSPSCGAREQASGAVVDQRRAADMPIVSALGGYQRTNHVTPYGFIQNGRLQHPLSRRARQLARPPRHAVADLHRRPLERARRRRPAPSSDASGKDLDAARADLRLETTRAFWALVTATDAVRVVQESVKRIDAQLSDVRARFDAGFLPPNDVLTVEARVSLQRTLLIEAENLRDGARAELARLMGVPVDAAFEADANLTQPGAAGSAAMPPESAGRRPRSRPGPSTRRRPCEPKPPRRRIDAARAEKRPSIAVVGGYDYARPNPRIFPRENDVGRLVGHRRQRLVDALERRPHRRARRRSAQPGRRGARAAGRARLGSSLSRSGSGSSISISARAQVDTASWPPSAAPPRPVASSPERFAVGRRHDDRSARRAGRRAPGRARTHARARQREAGRGAARAGARYCVRLRPG